MAQFTTSIDIANRALEMCGAKPIVAFTDNTVNAQETSFAYDKMRQVELRRSIWRFSTRRTALYPLDTNSLVLTPPAWNSSTLYPNSAIVSYNGYFWISNVNINLFQTPGVSNQWEAFFGSLQAEAYDTAATTKTTYFAGDLLYYTTPSLLYKNYFYIYTCKQTGLSTDPTSVQPYSASTTYNAGDIVTESATAYISMLPDNTNYDPASNSALSAWSPTHSYSSADQVVDPNTGYIYTSQANTNVGNYPPTDTGTNWLTAAASPYVQPWLVWSQLQANIGWVGQPQGGILSPPKIVYPINSGPLSLTGVQNVFRLPHGFLRRAPQQPMIGAVGFLGGPLGNLPDDYQFENHYFVSNTSTPIVLRFVADLQDVSLMDPMFCEGLAARVAMAVLPRLSQSNVKQQTLMGYYKEAMTSARLQNSIEMGPIQPAQDEFLNVRM